MKLSNIKLAATLLSVTLLALPGCGGGSSSTPQAPAITISGVAATGAAFVDAVVSVIDRTGAVVGTSTPVGSDGVFSVTLSSNAQAPFVLVASRTDANGETQTLVSVVESTTQTTANVTPITNLIASLLSPSGDSGKLAEELVAGTASITPDSVAATVTEVKTILATLLDATGTASTDPITGSFAVDGTGYDHLLDSISINIVPSSDTSSNIEIAVKQQLPDGTQPTTTSFTSDATTIAPLPAITGKLVEEGTAVKIANLLADLTACYAVPLEERIAGATVSDDQVSGTASAVVAPACRGAFDGNDPANYLSNGRRVASDGSFSGLFRRGATGLIFSQGSYEFTRGNGDLVIGYKTRSTNGSEAFDTIVVRKDLNDGKLKAIGNQYQFPGGVTAYQQHRQFLTLNQSAYNYRSTGYTFSVDDRKDSSGNSIFDRVEVTTSKGTTLTLKPAAGYSYLNLVKGNGTVVGTNFVRLRSAFDNPATTATFATMEPGLFFSNQGYTDADIAALPSQATWSFKYFLVGNTSTTPDAVQAYKTRARAMTIEELKARGLAQLSAQDIADIQAQAGQKGIDFEGEPDNVVHWTVPAGALPPTQVTLFGALFNTSTNPWTRLQGFNDSISFSSTARQSPLTPCSPAGANDLHCSNTPVPGSYAPGAYVNSLHLWARESSGREFASFFAMYPLNLAP